MTIKGLNIVIGADASKFNKAIEDINKTTRGLNAELRGINRSLKFDTKNPELLAQKQKILNERFSETTKKLNLLKSAQEQVNRAYADNKISEEEYRKYHNEVAITTSQLKGFEKQLQKATAEALKYDGVLGKMTAALEDAGESITKVGKKMMPASLAASGVLTGLAKAAIDFDSAWIGVQKTMADDITPKQLNNIKEGVKKMSKEIGVNAIEIAGVAEAAGQLGIETDSILDFTRVMIDLGVSTSLSSDVAATTLARFANVTKMSHQDFSRLGSTIVALGNNFATTETEISAMAMNLGAAGYQVGMSNSAIIALATSLSSVGLEASAGGTAFSKLLINMQVASETGMQAFSQLNEIAIESGISLSQLSRYIEQGGAPLEEYAQKVGISSNQLIIMRDEAVKSSEKLNDFAKVAGLTAEEFAEKFGNDATGALELFIKGLGDFDRNGKTSIAILDEMGIKESRLRDAIIRSTNASDIFTKALDMGNQAWEENNALQTEAQLRYDSVQGKWDQMKASFQIMAINLGDKLIPHLIRFFEWLNKVADSFGELDEGTQKFILSALGIVAIGGPLLIVLGKVVGGAGAVLGMFGKATKALGLFKAASVATTATSTALAAGTASTATAATGVVGSFGAAGAAIGSAALAAAPWIAAGAAIVGAGILIHKTLTADTVPAVDLFADSLDTSNQVVDEFGNTTGAVMIKISESTKENMGKWLEMNEAVQESNLQMFTGLVEVTNESTAAVKGQVAEMVDFTIEKNTERKDKTLATISELYASDKSLTEEQAQTILGVLETDYKSREVEMRKYQLELNRIYDEINTQAEGATRQQMEDIDRIMKQMTTNAASVLTESEKERNVILNRMNDYEANITRDAALDIVQALNQQKEDSIKTASDERDERIRIAEDLRAKGGVEAEAMADEIAGSANRMYDETVASMEGIHADGINQLALAYPALYNEINIWTGKARGRWDKFTTGLGNSAHNTRDEIQKTADHWNRTKFADKHAVLTYRTQETGPHGMQKHNNGLLNVPYNNYQALLHRNERVLTAYENKQLKEKGHLGNAALGNSRPSIANIDNSSTTNNFSLGGTYYIREESDIDKIAKQLHNYTLRKQRA